MKIKVIIVGFIIVIGIVFGAISFFESKIEYGDIATARSTRKKIQIKGEWIREKETIFDFESGKFIFFLKDDSNDVLKVIYEGPRPNNFEFAPSIVVKGRYQDDHFTATEILTKCPSKYEAPIDSLKKTF